MTTPPSITLYWRPGCGFCRALQRQLDSAGLSYAQVNIWEDPAGADFVRRANGGNELVPTITVADEVLSNPSADEVLALVNGIDR